MTKRTGNVSKMIPEIWQAQLPANVWLGITVVNQEEAERDVKKLLRIRASVRFLSMEPLLGPINFEGLFANPDMPNDGTNQLHEIDWVIVGGETGPGARPLHPDWVFDLRDQCAATETPFLFKQWGDWASAGMGGFGTKDGEIRYIKSDGTFWGDDLPSDDDADVLTVVRLGKNVTGRRLAGKTCDGYPTPRITLETV